MSYATPDQMLEQFDVRTIGQLVSDDGNVVSPAELLSNNILQACLDKASGRMLVVFVVGKRHSEADIQAIIDAGGYSADYLAYICCEIAFGMLWRRRPDLDSNAIRSEAYEQAEKALVSLRNGLEMFDVTANVNASVPKVTGPSSLQVRNLNGMADRLVRGRMAPLSRFPNNR